MGKKCKKKKRYATRGGGENACRKKSVNDSRTDKRFSNSENKVQCKEPRKQVMDKKANAHAENEENNAMLR
jgi:hypothetical protein